MIRVRYQDQLPPGLNGKAAQGARGTTVYLLPGLTGRQRRDALRRLRQEASRGCGPALPGAGLTVALAADRFRVGLRNTAAVIRQHPAGSLLPTALAGLLMTMFVFASVPVRMVQGPGGSGGTGTPASGAAVVIGYPALAQANPPAGPGPGARRGGGTAPSPPDCPVGARRLVGDSDRAHREPASRAPVALAASRGRLAALLAAGAGRRARLPRPLTLPPSASDNGIFATIVAFALSDLSW